MTLSPEAYDFALSQISAFLKEHSLESWASDDYVVLNKKDTLVFLQMVKDTGFGYLLCNEADCFVSCLDDSYELNDMVFLPLHFEDKKFEVMLQRVRDAPDNTEYMFHDFTSNGELVDVVRQRHWHTESHKRDYQAPDLTGLWKKSR